MKAKVAALLDESDKRNPPTPRRSQPGQYNERRPADSPFWDQKLAEVAPYWEDHLHDPGVLAHAFYVVMHSKAKS